MLASIVVWCRCSLYWRMNIKLLMLDKSFCGEHVLHLNKITKCTSSYWRQWCTNQFQMKCSSYLYFLSCKKQVSIHLCITFLPLHLINYPLLYSKTIIRFTKLYKIKPFYAIIFLLSKPIAVNTFTVATSCNKC